MPTIMQLIAGGVGGSIGIVIFFTIYNQLNTAALDAGSAAILGVLGIVLTAVLIVGMVKYLG